MPWHVVTPSPPSTRHGQLKKNDCPIIGSSNTIATALIDKKKTSMPDQCTLAFQCLFQTNPSQFYLYNEDAKSRELFKPQSSVRASLKNTAGPILDAFKDDPKERFNIIKSIRSEQQRAFDESMADTNSKTFQ